MKRNSKCYNRTEDMFPEHDNDGPYYPNQKDAWGNIVESNSEGKERTKEDDVVTDSQKGRKDE